METRAVYAWHHHAEIMCKMSDCAWHFNTLSLYNLALILHLHTCICLVIVANASSDPFYIAQSLLYHCWYDIVKISIVADPLLSVTGDLDDVGSKLIQRKTVWNSVRQSNEQFEQRYYRCCRRYCRHVVVYASPDSRSVVEYVSWRWSASLMVVWWHRNRRTAAQESHVILQ